MRGMMMFCALDVSVACGMASGAGRVHLSSMRH